MSLESRLCILDFGKGSGKFEKEKVGVLQINSKIFNFYN